MLKLPWLLPLALILLSWTACAPPGSTGAGEPSGNVPSESRSVDSQEVGRTLAGERVDPGLSVPGTRGALPSADGSDALRRPDPGPAEATTFPAVPSTPLREPGKDFREVVPAPVWTTHTDPARFSVEHPVGWQVQHDAASGRVRLQGPQGEEVVSWPVFLRTSLDAASAPRTLRQMAEKLRPGVSWQTPRAVGPGSAHLYGVSDLGVSLAILTWTDSPQGSAGQLYLVSAPAGQFRRAEDTFIRILQSFRAWGSPSEDPGGAALRYTRWRDPVEGAFSAEVPLGWTIEGGTTRPSALSVQGSVDAVSPDETVDLFIGDIFPWFVEPNTLLPAGSVYNDPMGSSWPVQYYAPGVEFVTAYLVPLHEEYGRSLEVVRTADRPDLAGQLARLGLQQIDAGELEYRFSREGVQYRGEVLAITEKVALPGGDGGSWRVWRLYAWEAPETRAEEAEAALLHMAETFLIDPQWSQRQANLTAAQSGIIRDMGDTISNTIAQGYQATQQTLDEVHRRGANARREVVEVVDPVTGAQFQVESGSSYYWLDQRGVIAGTDIEARPSIDFRQLIALP